ncbi:hypothetical protein D9Q98_006019 [Chlorella vulgaris]|uniref:Uncharacterized protein n=1 Tax=Chlorella vulgaris TaxID=3077 RepID=A0A9D4TWV7_CHLVU|nr:hypothetical protein D9Q98_006019 [Chlorella vulgaris]
MDILFLQRHEADVKALPRDDLVPELAANLESTLRELKHTLQAVVLESRSNRKEVRQWLINTLAGLNIENRTTRRRRFAQFLPGGAACRGAEHQAIGQAVLQLLFEAAPAEVGALIAQDASLLRAFFQSSSKHAPLWFGHFSMEGQRRFKFGAAALAQFAMAHRDKMWHLLAWQGRHSQSPVAVAQRTHYFSELDVPRTVRHLLRDCPEFWSSREMRASVEAGAALLLALDPGWWSKELLRWVEDGRSTRGDRLHEALCRCLEDGPWRLLCQRLLQLLPQSDMLLFANRLLDDGSFPGGTAAGTAGTAGTGNSQRGSQRAHTGPGAAQDLPGAWLIFRGVQWQSLDILLLAVATGCCLPLLLRLLREEDAADECLQVQSCLRKLLQLDSEPERQAAAVAAHWQLRHRLYQQRTAAATAELHELLLLHLFGAAFLVQQGSNSSRPAASELQQWLASSGFKCKLAEAGGELDHGSGKRIGKTSKSGSKNEKQKKRRGKDFDRKKKQKRRRRDHSSSSSSDSGSEHGDEEELSGHAEMFGGATTAAGTPAADALKQHQWLLPPASSGAVNGTAAGSVGGLELLDAVVAATATAYAAWLFEDSASWC